MAAIEQNCLSTLDVIETLRQKLAGLDLPAEARKEVDRELARQQVRRPRRLARRRLRRPVAADDKTPLGDVSAHVAHAFEIRRDLHHRDHFADRSRLMRTPFEQRHHLCIDGVMGGVDAPVAADDPFRDIDVPPLEGGDGVGELALDESRHMRKIDLKP